MQLYQKEMLGPMRGVYARKNIPPEPFELLQWNSLVWARFLTWLRTQDRALEDRVRQVSRQRTMYWVIDGWMKTKEAERFLSATHDPTLFQQYMEDVKGLIFFEKDLTHLPGCEWWARYNDGEDLLKKIGPKILWRQRFELFVPPV